MGKLCITLFGRFDVQVDGSLVTHFYPRKTQELLAYLLLKKGTVHSREKLAGTLYGDSPSEQARKSLRQTLWQLQTRLEVDAPECQLLQVEPDYVRINQQSDVTIDFIVFQESESRVRELSGSKLQNLSVHIVEEAVMLYHGDLLEGWYQDWCVFERERLQNMLLNLLHKLMAYCEAHREFETGLLYGERILSYDPACERAHRQMMRLHCLDGDRTRALRQYERCVAALRQELDVEPSERTVALLHQIQADRFDSYLLPAVTSGRGQLASAHGTMDDVLESLRRLRGTLKDLEDRLQPGRHESDLPLERS